METQQERAARIQQETLRAIAETEYREKVQSERREVEIEYLGSAPTMAEYKKRRQELRHNIVELGRPMDQMTMADYKRARAKRR